MKRTGGTSLRGGTGVSDCSEREVCHLVSEAGIGLLCPVTAVQKMCDWMVYVFNVAGIGSITVNLGETTKAIRHNQRPHLHLCVLCATLCFDKVFMTQSWTFHLFKDRHTNTDRRTVQNWEQENEAKQHTLTYV